MKSKRRHHHYVPVWYQKRFLPNDHATLLYLDLYPWETLADGRQIKLREMYRWGSKKCFYNEDLYTTRVFGTRNDEIEEYLFGRIDDVGSKAISALVAQNYNLLHKYFSEIFEYMDAQKLRTPKGLDWIRSNYSHLSQLDLMIEMQQLRTMHCTMWAEAVMEIVSAEESDVKFIISDHPVTIYNPDCPPGTEICNYPNDPPTRWLGSQTIFPVDRNHCFILTNLEYARDPDKSIPTNTRTNPRCFAQTLTRWDTIIRSRKLKPEAVHAINYIVKSRARKYIAGFHSEWLYPENYLTDKDWRKLREVLLPPKDKLWNYGGEIYVGGEDGKLMWYQDEFGRRFTDRESKDDPVRKYTIKHRNQILFNAILEIFGFSKGKTWDEFRREICDDEVRELYRVVGGLWNPDTEILNLLPKPCDSICAFYSGTTDPRVTPITVAGYSLYVDRIILISPFQNPRLMTEEYSPIKHPSQYKYETIKNVLFMMQIMPFIDAGIVEMIPDPCDFDPFLRKRIYEMAKARLTGFDFKKHYSEEDTLLARDDFARSLLNMPSESLKYHIKKVHPNLSEEEISKVAEYAQFLMKEDTISLLQDPIPGKEGGQLNISHMGGNLEMGIYLSQITGSFIYTDFKVRWKEILDVSIDKGCANPWDPLSEALSQFHFRIHPEASSNFLCHLREHNIFYEFRKIIRDMISEIRKTEGKDESSKAVRLADDIRYFSTTFQHDILDKEIEIWFEDQTPQSHLKSTLLPISYMIPFKGMRMNTVKQLLLTHGSDAEHSDTVPMAAFINWHNMDTLG